MRFRKRPALMLFCLTLIAETCVAQVELQPRSPWTTSRIHGAPTPPAPYRITPAFPKLSFSRPTSVLEIPQANRMLVTEAGGKILSFVKEFHVDRADLVIDLREHLPPEHAGQGVSTFHATLHHQFPTIRQMFVCYKHPGNGGHVRVSRFALRDGPIPVALPDSEQVILTWRSNGHSGGCLQFGADKYLYISTGDGAGPNPPDGLTTGQDLSDLLGSILRIDVDHTDGERPYVVPEDNPFVDLEDVRPEIWAYGLRNPWKFGIDQQSGQTYVADNGWETWESIHLVQRGSNCGWPIMEGRAVLRSEVKAGPTPITPPLKDHPHTEANSVIGGPVYRGTALPGLDGFFVYGDYITGTIWAVRTDANDDFAHRTLVDTDQRIAAFAQGTEGELYVLDHDFTGQIYQLLPSQMRDTSADFPRLLSRTGLFSSLETLEPSPGVVPYQVIVERWMDGATAQRWVAIPGEDQIRLPAQVGAPTVYPADTVLVKQLAFPRGDQEPLQLETQVLHYSNGVWNPYSYVWNEDGSDAVLADSIGMTRSLTVPDPNSETGVTGRSWHVSAVNECRLCHNVGSQFVLGFTPNQLNRKHPRESRNQLAELKAQHVIAETPAIADEARLVDPHDQSQTLDARARSYLHGNCAACHHPGGNAIVSFYLNRELPFSQLRTNKGTNIGTFGISNAKVIAAGDPFRSVLIYRMSKLGYSRMPYIGSQVVDSSGVALVTDWVRSLDDTASPHLSSPALADSKESIAIQNLASGDLATGQRDAAIGILIDSTEGALALVTQMHKGSIKDDIFAAAVATGRKTRADQSGLFETFIPESKRLVRLGPNPDPKPILQLSGDPARGKLIFYSDNGRCRACHEVDDPTQSVGPTLMEIRKKYPNPAELLSHILKPSLKVEDRVAGYAVLTTDGRLLSGLLLEETNDLVTLKTVDKKIVQIKQVDIESMRKSEKSLMPDGILGDLTAEEAADLLAFIGSLNPK